MTIVSILSSSAITAILASLISRNRYKAEIEKIKAETDTIYLENVKEAIQIWKSTADQLKVEVANLNKQVIELRTENKNLKEDLRKEFNKLDRSINNSSRH